MTSKIIAYHGTGRERGLRIIENQMMEISKGDRHWLGDGSYFFSDDFWSYKWCRELYKDRYGNYFDDEKFCERYQILEALIEVERDRIFDMDKMEFRMIFDMTYEEMAKMEDYAEVLKVENLKKKRLFAEGVVINYIFLVLNYIKNYDMISATFIRNQDNYQDMIRTNLAYIAQCQLCVKIFEIVRTIREYDYETKVETYKNILDVLFREKKSVSRYVSRKRNRYYNK